MWRDTWGELRKLMVQKKNYIMVAGHLFFLLLCYLGFKMTAAATMQRRISGGSDINFDSFFEMIDGMFFARIALYPTFLVLMPIMVATLAGEIVAGEYQEGTLKLYLARPRSRTRVILSKFAAVYIVNIVYCLYYAVFALIAGGLLFGFSPIQMLAGDRHVIGNDLILMHWLPALGRYFLVVLYFSFSLMALGSLALWFSTIFNRMTAATISTLSFYFVCFIFGSLPLAEELRPYLLSDIMNRAFIFWLPQIPWQRLVLNIGTLTCYIVFFCGAALTVFHSKDIR